MKVLLSIKPEFAEKIFDGTKLYEFRRSIFKNPDIDTVVVYASSPVQKLIGEFRIDCILNESLVSLWKKTKKHSGISERFFFDYFDGKENAFPIKVKQVKKYKQPLCIREDFQGVPPQSFMYL